MKIAAIWRDGAFHPVAQHLRRWGDKLDADKMYVLEIVEGRSAKSHRHYFAALHDLWANLPEMYDGAAWAVSPEHFRKYLLIKSGWCTCQEFTCGSKAEAMRWASNMGLAMSGDDYAICQASDSLVRVFRAKSQSVRAMGKDDFQKSKEDVLREAAALVNVDPAPILARQL